MRARRPDPGRIPGTAAGPSRPMASRASTPPAGEGAERGNGRIVVRGAEPQAPGTGSRGAGSAAPGRPGRASAGVGSATPTAGGWVVEGVRFRYRRTDAVPALDDVSLEVTAGTCTALLGPNGSGKSTLLRLMLGLLRPEAGEIRLAGRPVEEWSRRELARTVGVVSQHEEISFPLTVRELVAMGRYPHLGAFRAEGAVDTAAIREAMVLCDVLELADRPVNALSGGERQRARLARALAQEPRMLALDEPTLALDIRYEMEIFELLRVLVGSGVTVLLATHNLNLAARYADTLLLLDRGRVAATGAPADVLRRDLLERAYRWPIRTTLHPGPGRDEGIVQVTPLSREPQQP